MSKGGICVYTLVSNCKIVTSMYEAVHTCSMYEFTYGYIRQLVHRCTQTTLELQAMNQAALQISALLACVLCIVQILEAKACFQDVSCLIHVSISLMTGFCNGKAGLYYGALSAIDAYMCHHGQTRCMR